MTGRTGDATGREPDPRFSLANERTLLAYNRTALALVVAGMAISGSHTVADTPVWLAAIGLPLISFGAVVAFRAPDRFARVQHAMHHGEPLPPPRVAVLISRGVAGVALAALAAAAAQLF